MEAPTDYRFARTLNLLILKSLVSGESRGLGISRRIQQITAGTFLVKPGALFPQFIAWRTKVGFRRFGEIPKTAVVQSTTA